MSRPAIVNRFLNDILEWLRSFGRWPGFLPEPKVLKYLPDYLRLGSGYKTDDLHPGMAFGTFKGINLPHFLDALPPCFRRSNLRDHVGSGAPIGKAHETSYRGNRWKNHRNRRLQRDGKGHGHLFCGDGLSRSHKGELNFNAHCPNGRPTWVEWTVKDIEKAFKRVV